MEIFLAVILCAVGGISVFFLSAGYVVYGAMMCSPRKRGTTTAAQEKGLNSGVFSHIRDERIMEPLLASKQRWQEGLTQGIIERLSVMSKKGVFLSGYYYSAEGEARKLVVLVHGILDSAAGLGYLAEEYHKRGWDVLNLDLRGHGESGGTRYTMGVREAEDLALWIDLIQKKWPKKEVLIHGISLGGATALMYSGFSEVAESPVKGVVSDSSFGSYKEAAKTLVTAVVRVGWIAQGVVCCMSFFSILHTGIGFGKMRPEEAVTRKKIPVLAIHGEADALVPLATISGLLSGIQGLLDEVLIVPDAPHIGAYFYKPEAYMNHIEAFATRSMG